MGNTRVTKQKGINNMQKQGNMHMQIKRNRMMISRRRSNMRRGIRRRRKRRRRWRIRLIFLFSYVSSVCASEIVTRHTA